MPPGFASRAEPHYGAQPCTAYASDLTGTGSMPFRGFEQMQLGMNRGPTEQTQVGSGMNYSTDVQGASSMGILGDGSNCTGTNSHGPVATSQPLFQDVYPTVSVFYITTTSRDDSPLILLLPEATCSTRTIPTRSNQRCWVPVLS